jgi:hypothetical protein
MTWSDRRAFLRSVSYSRLLAVFGGLMWARSLYDTVTRWYRFLLTDSLHNWVDVCTFLLALGFVAECFAVLYAFWIQWKYADLLREVAGGTTADMSGWSQMHLRTIWAWGVATVISMGQQIANWALERAVVHSSGL